MRAVPVLLHPPRCRPPGGRGGGRGPKADALFDQVHSAPSIDSARRVAADLMQVAVVEENVAVPLAALSNVWLLSPQVEGFEAAAIGGTQQWHRVFRSR